MTPSDVLSDPAMTPDLIVAALTPKFNRFASNSIAIINALMSVLSGLDEEDGAKSAAIQSVRKGTRAAGLAAPAPADIVPVQAEVNVRIVSSDEAKAAVNRTIKNMGLALSAAPDSKG